MLAGAIFAGVERYDDGLSGLGAAPVQDPSRRGAHGARDSSASGLALGECGAPTVVRTDLHGHTLFSDGRTTPESYVRFRASLGMQVIALSDHDTFAGVPRAAVEAARAGLVLIPAMEASSFIHFHGSRPEQVHVLGYYPPSLLEGGRLERTQMYARSLKVHAAWKAFVLEWLRERPSAEREILDPEGLLPDMDPFEFPALQPFIDLLVLNRQKAAFRAFFEDHVRFWTGAPELFGWSPEELIETIRGDGGTDVVAHPNRIRDRERMLRVLEFATGVEVYTSRHKPKTAARFRAFAEARGKLWTASSDDHQHVEYVVPAEGTPCKTVERLMGLPV